MNPVSMASGPRLKSMFAFHKIVCPVDFSAASYEGLKKAIELAQRDLTELCVLYVVPTLSMHDESLAIAAHSEAARQATAVKNLSVVVQQLPESLRARPLLKQGEAAEEIVRAAREENADLIVLTAHGAHSVHNVPGSGNDKLGPVAQSVLQSAPCPVLLINGPASTCTLTCGPPNQTFGE